MNRFKIVLGKESQFEDIWRNRDSHLDNVPGFVDFNLIKGSSNEDFTLYASHSRWNSEEDFVNWTKSESFRTAHKTLVNIKVFISVIPTLKVSRL